MMIRRAPEGRQSYTGVRGGEGDAWTSTDSDMDDLILFPHKNSLFPTINFLHTFSQ